MPAEEGKGQSLADGKKEGDHTVGGNAGLRRAGSGGSRRCHGRLDGGGGASARDTNADIIAGLESVAVRSDGGIP